MKTLPISVGKRMKESLKAACRFLCRPIVPLLSDKLANRLPFLGRVCVQGPNQLCIRFLIYGPHGKDRIALKLARRGFSGYEGETIRLFLPLIQQAQNMIDIGANTGLFALLAAKANPDCRVWAFEPVPFIFDMLKRNIRLNQLTNLQAVPFALADFSGESTFFVTRTNVGIPTDSSSCAGFRSQVEELRLQTTTLDAYVERHGLARLDVLKIDAEAAESKIIRGAAQTLRTHRPFVICEVLENIDHRFVQDTLEALDYRFFHVGPHCLQRQTHLHGSLSVDQRNYLFVPAEKVERLQAICRQAAISVHLALPESAPPGRMV